MGAESHRFLILEDNPADAELIQFELEEAGISFTAKVVMSEKDFVRELQEFAPDLILSDYDLPTYNGALALAEASNRCPDVPFILVTGAVTEDRAIEILTNGAKDFVMKHRLQKLAPAVRRAMAEAEEHRARKKAEAEILEKSHYTRSLIEASLDPLVTISPEGKVMDVNKATEEITGVPRDQMIGTDFTAYFTEPEKARAGYEKAFLDGSVKGYPLALRHVSGRITDVLYNATTYTNEKGEVKGVFAAARDVTELKVAEEQLRKANRDMESLVEKRTIELRTVLDTAPVAIWIAHDSGCKLITGNAFADKIIMKTSRLGNISRSAAPGKAVVSYKVFHDGVELKPEEMPAQVATATGKPVTDMEVELVFSDGRHVHLIESAMPLFDSDGRVRGAVITGSDVSQIKQSEIAFKQSEERIQQALCVSHSFTFEWELATDRVRRSESCATILGLTGDEAVNDTGQNYFQRVHPDDRARFVAMLDRLTPANASYTVEYRVVRGDGHVVVFEETGAATFDAAGKLARLAGVTTDSTVRKQAEDALRVSAERLRLATAATHALVYDLDVASLRVAKLDGLRELLGYEPSEAELTLDWWDRRIHPDDMAMCLATFQRMRSDGHGRTLHYRLRHKDGRIIDVEDNATAVRDTAGNIVRIVGTVVDITARKQAEVELARTKALLETLLTQAPVGFAYFDRELRYLLINDQLAEVNGLPVAAHIGKTIGETVPTLLPAVQQVTSQILATGQPVRDHEFNGETAAQPGVTRYWNESWYPVCDAAGEIVGFGAVVEETTARKRAEEALRESEDRLRRIAQDGRIGIFEWNATTDAAYWSREHYELFGMAPGTPISWERWRQGVHPDDRERVEQNAARMLEQGRAQGQVRNHTDEYRYRRPDGTEVWLESNVSLDMVGNEAIVRGSVRDVTDRKWAEESMRKQQWQLRLAMQAGKLVPWTIDLVGEKVEPTPQLLELFGLGPDAPLGSPADWQALIHEEDRPKVFQSVDAAKTGQEQHLEYRILHSDGTIHWHETHGIPLADATGCYVRLVGYVCDVTDRKQAEDALRASEARFRLTLKNSPVLVTLQDTNLVYQWVFNTRTRRPEEVVGKTDADLFAPDEAAALSAAKSQVLETGTEVRETFWLTSNGQRVFLDCYYEPVRDAAGKIIGVGGASVDLTEQKQAEEALTERTRQLDDANEELDSFAYSVSHDLRAPLRAIDGFARMILKQQGDKFDEKTRNQFDVIIKNTKMMGQLIEDLLALSRLGRQAISMSKLNIEDLAQDVWEELNAINPDRPVDLKIDHAPPATGDRSFIKQVLVNLLSNAIKFTRIREVPLIEVGGYDGKAENVYYVRDNGVGFDMQYLDKLFGVFQRLHSTNEYEGTGIGLALVKRIIHRHGGQVWAEAEVGKGATFYFTLPTG